ncbi:PoNe immunity protein domain-containing protein [Duganella sp. BJB476]|uniref:PoNe immunity protein domain-containing protein n=1 Tax=Duganella sp. BJB476 TaxID=1871176 RepID=UPI000E3485BC|nr:PoNe immunity protein domain-containing protein [Duganella sp. BJB476]RFP28734.1 DUF1911 domain-containing protein [Duganella sp. BJB476]
MQFHEKRRQQFLNENYYNFFTNFIEKTILHWRDHIPSNAGSEVFGRALASIDVANQTFDLFILKYTGGEPIDTFRDDLTKVIETFELNTIYEREYSDDPNFPPLRFAEIDEYERAMQLIGLCYLLHRRDLLPRLAAMLDGAFAGKDTLYEDMFAYELKDRYEVDEWYHDKPYRDLINSFYRDTPEESIMDIDRYLKAWYQSMKKAPWHDSHLDTSEAGGAYSGYWAIEAAAAVYLLDLDDRSFRDHIVYPKDLVDYARNLDKQLGPASSVPEELRVEGGKPCPQTGNWFSPAIPDSLRHFEQGEIMPVSANSQYGVTIWQWSTEQLPPLKPTVE